MIKKTLKMKIVLLIQTVIFLKPVGYTHDCESSLLEGRTTLKYCLNSVQLKLIMRSTRANHSIIVEVSESGSSSNRIQYLQPQSYAASDCVSLQRIVNRNNDALKFTKHTDLLVTLAKITAHCIYHFIATKAAQYFI